MFLRGRFCIAPNRFANLAEIGPGGGLIVAVVGHVIADVEVPDLPESFIDARVLVRLPVDTRSALMVPETAVITRTGLDFVEVASPSGPVLRTVVLGQRQTLDGAEMIEILSGLMVGDRVVTAHE